MNTTPSWKANRIVVMLGLMALYASWHWVNRRYPISDHAEYAVLGQWQYLTFLNEGLIASLREAYWYRAWKPILMGPFLVPSLIVFSGKVIPSVAATLGVLYAVLLSYLGQILREYCSAGFAAFGLLLLATSPFLINSSHVFMSELPFMTCFIAAVYHGLKSHRFSRLGHGILAGVAAGIGMMIRPCEGLLLLGPLFLGLLWTARDRQRPWRADGALVMAAMALAAWHFSAPLYSKAVPPSQLLWQTAGFALMSTLLAIKATRSRPINSVLLSATIAYALPTLWYAPFSYSLVSWIWQCSWGELTQPEGYSKGATLPFLFGALWKLFTGVYWVLFIAALVFVIARFRVLRQSEKFRGTLKLACTGLAVFIILLLGGSTTLNPDLRYYYAATLLAETALVLFWAQKALPAPGFRLGALVVLSVFQFTAAASNLTSWAWHSKSTGLEFEKPDRSEDPGMQFYRRIETKFRPDSQYRIAMNPLFNPSLQHADIYGLQYALDPWRLTLISREQRRRWTFSLPHFRVSPMQRQNWARGKPKFSAGELQAFMDFIAKNYDYRLVYPYEPASDFASASRQYCPPICLEFVDRLPSPAEPAQLYALFRVENPKP